MIKKKKTKSKFFYLCSEQFVTTIHFYEYALSKKIKLLVIFKIFFF